MLDARLSRVVRSTVFEVNVTGLSPLTWKCNLQQPVESPMQLARKGLVMTDERDISSRSSFTDGVSAHVTTGKDLCVQSLSKSDSSLLDLAALKEPKVLFGG